MVLDLQAMRKLATESAHSRALFLDTVLRPVGGWGEEGGLARRQGLREVPIPPSRQIFIPR
jgi:hypothetical protein